MPAAADPYSEPDPYEDEPEGYPEMAMQAVYPAPKKSGKGGAYGGRGKRSLYGYRGGFGRFGGFGYPFVSFRVFFLIQIYSVVEMFSIGFRAASTAASAATRSTAASAGGSAGGDTTGDSARRPARSPERLKLVEPDR